MNLGIALSGGGIRGAAHIGVLQALEEEGIKVSYISGTSSGSIVATLYAIGYTPKEILKMFNMYCKFISKTDKKLPLRCIKTLFTGKLDIKGFSNGNNLEKLMYNYCLNKNVFSINDIKMPIAIPAVNLCNEKTYIFLNRKVNRLLDKDIVYEYFGSISEIVRASTSLPAFFYPKVIDNKIFVDGGISLNTPVSVLKQMGAERVIAVCFDETPEFTNNYNIFNVTLKSFEIMGQNINESEVNKADLRIYPKVKNGYLLDCSQIYYYYNQGYVETKKAINEIKKLF